MVRMVFVVFSRAAFEELCVEFGRCPSPIWVGQDVLTPVELVSLRNKGIDVTNFTNEISVVSAVEMDAVLDTVRMHHPDKIILSEYSPTPTV